MKLLLIGGGSSPYLFSLASALKPYGYEIDILDPYDGWFQQDGTGEKRQVFCQKGSRLKPWARILRLKQFLREQERQYDICNVHYNSAIYGLIPGSFRDIAAHLVVSIWGSDMRNPYSLVRRIQKRLLDRADLVTINNPDEKATLVSRFGISSDKVSVAFMPIKSLDAIGDMMRYPSAKENAKKLLGFPPKKLVVLCGTNARPAQNHIAILESLESSCRDCETIKDAHYVFPLTYGGQGNEYLSQLIPRIEQSPLSASILTDYLSESEMVALRVCCDGIVQIQSQDMFSAVMQEGLFAGSWVVTGKWLPYSFLKEKVPTLKFIESSEDVGDSVSKMLSEPTLSCDVQLASDSIIGIAGMKSCGRVWNDILSPR